MTTEVPHDIRTHHYSARDIQFAEWRRIHRRRYLAGLSDKDQSDDEPAQRPEDLVGLGLSGGGIRSAVFNLGLLQGLRFYDVLRHVDYLSTVSGGGYVGASMTWFASVLGRDFPYIAHDEDSVERRGEVRNRLQYLRAHGSYLIPGDGLNLWSLIAAIVAGSLTTMAVLLPVLVLVVALLATPLVSAPDCTQASVNGWLPPCFNTFDIALGLGVFSAALFGVSVLVYGIVSSLGRGSKIRSASAQRMMREGLGRLLAYALALIVLGCVPIVYEFIATHFQEWKATAMSGISIGGALSFGAGLFGAKKGSEVRLGRSSLLSLGLLLAVFGVMLWIYHLVHAHVPALLWDWRFLALLGVSVMLAWFANINHVSMHRFYRNRLMESFMPVPDEPTTGDDDPAERLPQDPDQCFLHAIPQTDYPYHLICTNVQTVGSTSARLRQRGGDSFLLSPEYCGSEATEYVRTQDFVGGSMNLATAMAISGAAADTNSYATRSRPLVFLMTLFNIRLGYWIRNPRHTTPSPAQWRASKQPMWTYPRQWLAMHRRPMWYWYLFREVFGRGMDEDALNVRLSDGGHFENLGLYELIRRRCKTIIISDVGCDREMTFGDLGRAVERVRADFGTLVDINLDPLHPESDEGFCEVPFVTGTITYLPDGDLPRDEGILIYVKSAQLKNVPPDVVAYRAANPDFPDESTGDQFFDEEQFEAYRELGFASARLLCSRGNGYDGSAKDACAGALSHFRAAVGIETHPVVESDD